MSSKSKNLRAFVSSCETKTEVATPALVPKLRFPEFRKADGWKIGKIDDLVDTVTPPQKLPTSTYAGTGAFPIIDQSQNDICGWTDDTDALIQEDLPLIVFGDHTCILKLIDRPFAQGADGIKILKSRPKIGTSFLYQFLSYRPVVTEEYKRHYSILKEKLVAFPDFKTGEQQKIAECLSSVDELIAAQARKVDALKTHKKGLMQQLFPREGETQPRLRFPEFQNAGEWVSRTGTEITSKITKGSSPNWQGFSYQTQGVLFVTSENVRDGFLDVSEPKFLPQEFYAKQSNSHLLCGDILINIVGASIGRNCVYRLKEPAFTNQAVALFRVTKEHSFEFISYCYQQDRSQKAVSASQSDSARPNLSLGDLRTMEFFIPSRPEQQRIADCLTSLDDLIAAQTQKLEALKTHKKGLMQQLFPSPEEVVS
jgi:type I restriction enzyme S subunit